MRKFGQTPQCTNEALQHLCVHFIFLCFLSTSVFQLIISDFILFFSLNLYELIKKNYYDGFSLSLIRKFAVSLVQCLQLLHRENIIHCDLKPVIILIILNLSIFLLSKVSHMCARLKFILVSKQHLLKQFL